jgi:DNA-binding NarL/FixJ family response regulator
MQELAETTVVLADDHAIVREGIAALCKAHGMSVLGQPTAAQPSK